jgi:hypothetical protein
MTPVRQIAPLLVATLAFATPVMACEQDPFLFVLPGESLSVAKKRSKAIESDRDVIRSYHREEYAAENAKAIYLGRVVSSEETTYMKLPWTVPSTKVEPTKSLKGELPRDRQQLIDEAQTGTCTHYGDGHGAWAKVGDLVVVFVGLPTSAARPNGIDSLMPSEIRTIGLLDALRAAGRDVEEEAYETGGG